MKRLILKNCRVLPVNRDPLVHKAKQVRLGPLVFKGCRVRTDLRGWRGPTVFLVQEGPKGNPDPLDLPVPRACRGRRVCKELPVWMVPQGHEDCKANPGWQALQDPKVCRAHKVPKA